MERKEEIKTSIIDLDDTLTPNFQDYCFAQIKFLEKVVEKLWPKGPDVQTIINLEAKIDSELVSTMGFSKERFPTSFVETYKELCKPLGKTPTNKELDEMFKIGETAFGEKIYKQNGLFEGVAETLDFLLSKKQELIILTKGDAEIQRMKIKTHNLYKWFGKNIYIVPEKNERVIKEVVGNRNPEKVWHIGNSQKNDIGPALRAGIKAIYIPLETWAWERDHSQSEREENQKNKNFYLIKKFSDIKKQYHQIYG